MHPRICKIVDDAEIIQVRVLLEGIFIDLYRLLGYLKQMKSVLSVGESDNALFLLDIVRNEALAATGGIDFQRACLGLPFEVTEELERMSFAIRHELRTVSLRMSANVEGSAELTVATRLADAHDVLHNCFQQSVIAFARVFDSTLDGPALFDDIRIKRDTSILLYEDLSALLRSASHAAERGDPNSLSLFSERLEYFRSGSMKYLMQKDCETCVQFIEDFSVSQFSDSVNFFLRRFYCYLELLLNHISMRSVLAGATLKNAA